MVKLAFFQTKLPFSISKGSTLTYKWSMIMWVLGWWYPSMQLRPLTVEWPYFWATLEAFDFGQDFIVWAKLVYHAPIAKVCLNEWLSKTFFLGRGMQQACPLSPLLYALSGAQCIHADPNLKGLLKGAFEEHIGLFAEDIILYLWVSGAPQLNILEFKLPVTYWTFQQ